MEEETRRKREKSLVVKKKGEKSSEIKEQLKENVRSVRRRGD